MFGRTRDGGSFSEVSTGESSWRARLNPNIAPAWPNPQDSVGNLCCKIGNQIFWELKDPGRAKLAALEVEIQKFLNDHNEHLKERESSNISFSLFMIGRHETVSCPILVVISTNKKSRGRVVESIRNSGILEKYEGVLLGQSSRHPRYPDSGPAKYIASGSGKKSSGTFPSGVSVYIKSSDRVVGSGTSIYIPVDPVSESTHFRRATLGGILEMIRKNSTILVAMTVAHPFQEEYLDAYVSDQSEASENEMFEFEFDGPTPDDVFVDNGRRSSCSKYCVATSRNTRLSSHRNRSLYPTQVFVESGSTLTVLGFLTKTSLNSQHNLDWALIEITATGLGISNTIPSRVGDPSIEPILRFSRADKDVAVGTSTGSEGSNSGTMSGSSTFLKLKYSDTFEEVKTVTLRGTLSHGDSGSWIIEKNSGKLCGHIVAGDPSTALAYIIPARAVFEQIEHRYECRLELPKRDYFLPEDMSERMSQLQLSPSTMEGVLEETEKNAQPRSVPPTSYRDPTTHQSQNYYGPPQIIPAAASLGSSMTSGTSFYPQSSSQAGYQPAQFYSGFSGRGSSIQPPAGFLPPQAHSSQLAQDYSLRTPQGYSPRDNSQLPADIAGYQQSQVYPSQSNYSQPSAGYQQENQGYPSSNYRVPRVAQVADTGISAVGVHVAQPPTVEPTGFQYGTQPRRDRSYDRAGQYMSQTYPYDDGEYQERSSYDQVSELSPAPIASDSLPKHEFGKGRDLDRDLRKAKGRDHDRDIERAREQAVDRDRDRKRRY